MLKKIVIAAAALAVLGSDASFAASVLSTGSTMGVSANITTSCIVSATTAMNFGTVSTVLGATSTSGAGSNNGGFNVTCDTGTPYSVGLGSGSNGARRMSFGTFNPATSITTTTFLPYELYTDPTFSTVFADVTLADSVGKAGTVGGSASNSFIVYGKLVGSTKPVPGNYTDSVTVNLIY